jgi:type I restriction enzyme R subunit
MQQAIEEGFILDVLRNYTTYRTAFRLVHGGQDYDSETVDRSKAMKSVMQWVKLHPYNIGQKVAIIVEHFRANVAPLLNGNAKAMVVTDSRKSAVRYKLAMDKYIAEHHLTDVATLVAFSGSVDDPESGPEEFTEHSMNVRPARPHHPGGAGHRRSTKLLIVANKYQTGFDQPLLCAMYVDKRLDGVQCVQTLSRLNRTYPGKTTYVLDFVNHADDVLGCVQGLLRGRLPHAGQRPQPRLRPVGQARRRRALRRPRRRGLRQGLLGRRDHQAQSGAAVRRVWRRSRNGSTRPTGGHGRTVTTARSDRLDTFRRDLRTFVGTYDFLAAIVDYDDVDLEKRATFARLLAEALKDSNRHEDTIDLSDVTLTHHALHKRPEQQLDLAHRAGGGARVRPRGRLARPT